MERTKYLIDTNVVIDYLGNKLHDSSMKFMNDVIDALPLVSIITKIEVLGFNAPDEHYTTLFNFINDTTVLDLDENVVNASIEIRKKYKTKLPDAIIAATCLVYDLILIT
jgi:predicted nucleic acid-binding protein